MSMHVIICVDATIEYVVPSKVTSVPVLPVLTTTTGRPIYPAKLTFSYLFMDIYHLGHCGG